MRRQHYITYKTGCENADNIIRGQDRAQEEPVAKTGTLFYASLSRFRSEM